MTALKTSLHLLFRAAPFSQVPQGAYSQKMDAAINDRRENPPK
jgi:hypothetical protein